MLHGSAVLDSAQVGYGFLQQPQCGGYLTGLHFHRAKYMTSQPVYDLTGLDAAAHDLWVAQVPTSSHYSSFTSTTFV